MIHNIVINLPILAVLQLNYFANVQNALIYIPKHAD